MSKLTREQAERIVASRTSLCCGRKMQLKVVSVGLAYPRFTAWAECEAKVSSLGNHESELLGDLIH